MWDSNPGHTQIFFGTLNKCAVCADETLIIVMLFKLQLFYFNPSIQVYPQNFNLPLHGFEPVSHIQPMPLTPALCEH